MKKDNIEIKCFIKKFKKMKKAQNLLHFVFVISIIALVVLKTLNIVSTQNTYLTIVLLFIYALWLTFTSLYKQNQAFFILNTLYKDVKNKKYKL